MKILTLMLFLAAFQASANDGIEVNGSMVLGSKKSMALVSFGNTGPFLMKIGDNFRGMKLEDVSAEFVIINGRKYQVRPGKAMATPAPINQPSVTSIPVTDEYNRQFRDKLLKLSDATKQN